jgi:rubrerythrin
MARPGHARDALVRRLRLAYAGELAAARAYAGHWRSIRGRGAARAAQRGRIRQIMAEELEHRREVGRMLGELGHRPSRLRDAAMWCVGTAIAASCFAGGWYAPMYGAGRIERRNIWEYEDAVRLAAGAGLATYAERLLGMAEVEWDHERYFHDLVRSHWLHGRFGSWPEPGPRAEIRASFERGQPAPPPPRRRAMAAGARAEGR